MLDDAVKITGVSDDHARIALCADALRRHVGEHVSAARSQAYYVDVTHPDATKATVVQRVARLLDVPLGQVAAIGDMPNDVLMFGIAGTSIAMGNATPEVQRTARHVTTSNEDEGFAHAVESFILPGREGATCSKRGSLGFPPGTRA